MRSFLRILCCFLVLLTGCGQKNQGSETLMVGTSAEYPPFEYQHEGKVEGYDMDLIEAIAKRLNRSVEVQDMSFASLIPALNSGRIDVMVAALSVTPERERNVDFSDVYYYNTITAVFRKETPLTSTPQLLGKHLGVQLGSTMEQFAKQLQQKNANTQLKSLESNLSLVEDLKIGRIDAVIVEEAQAAEFLKRNPELGSAVVEASKDGYAIAFKKGSPLRDAVNQVLRDFEKDGTLATLHAKWFETGTAQ